VESVSCWFSKDELNWDNVRVERAIKHWQAPQKVSHKDLPTLQRQLIEIQIQDEPFHSTESFDYFLAREVQQHVGKFLSCILKISTSERGRAQPDWFAKLHAQIICKDWSYPFNALLASRGQRSLQFPEGAILELAEREHVLCKADFFETIEPPWDDDELQALASAFKHFIYWKTDHKIVCSRLWNDKICGQLMEPELHSVQGDLFGRGDRGDEAFHTFVNSHRCNEYCSRVRAPFIQDRMLETLHIGHGLAANQGKLSDQEEHSLRFRALRSKLMSVSSLSLKTKVHNSPVTIDLYIFPSLTSLRIDRVKIAKFVVQPQLLHSLQKLEVISAVDSLSTVLQPHFDLMQQHNAQSMRWERLKKLTVSDSDVVFTDRCLSNLPSIVKISLSHNQIQAIRNLHECVSLRELDLRNNQISSVFKINQAIGNVQTLLLTSNLISDPVPLSKLFGLKLLDLSYNLISEVSLIKGFAKLPYLKMLWLKGNPIAYTKSYRINVICELLPILEDSDRLPFELDSQAVTANEIKKAKKISAGEVVAADGVVEPAVEFISFKPFRKVISNLNAALEGEQSVSKHIQKEVENTTMVDEEEVACSPSVLSISVTGCPIDDEFDLAMEYFSGRHFSMPKATSDRCKALMKQATVGDCPHKKQPRMFTRGDPTLSEGDALWSTYLGMSSLDAKRLFLQTIEHHDADWRTEDSSRGAGRPLDIPELPSDQPLRTFVAVKSRNQEASLKALGDEFGNDLMDTFSFLCECSYDEACPERPPRPSAFTILLSHFVIQEKDPNTHSTQFRRRTNQIVDFDVFDREIRINFRGDYWVRYEFHTDDEQSLFERKLATSILTDSVYKFLENDQFMGRVPKLRVTPLKKTTPVIHTKAFQPIMKNTKLSRISQDYQHRKSEEFMKEFSHSYENSMNLGASLSPSDPMTIHSSTLSASMAYTDSVDTESLSRSKRELSDAVKRFWTQKKQGDVSEEFSKRFSCRLLRIKSDGRIGERNVIILVWDQHIFMLYSKGKNGGSQPSNLFYGHISSLRRIERGYHDQYFSLDFFEKSYSFMTRDPVRTREICSRLNQTRSEALGFSNIIVQDSVTLPKIIEEVEFNAKVSLYSHVYAPAEEKSRRTFTMRNGMHVLAQVLILTGSALYLCDEDCHFIMNKSALSQSKRRRLETSNRFTVVKKAKLLSITSIQAAHFQPQSFTIEFSDGEPWRLISQSSNSNLLGKLQSQTQRILHSFSSPSSGFDNRLQQTAELERVVIELP